MWTKLHKTRLTLISAMIILLPLVATAGGEQTQIDKLIQLIKQSAQEEGKQLTEDEIKKWVDRLLKPPVDPPSMRSCWVSSVESYNPGNPKPWPQFSDPQQILGEPNAGDLDHTKSVSLGDTLDENGPYGEITVSFGNQFTVRPQESLYLYEVGTDNESVYLQVRRADTGTYYPANPGLLVTTDFHLTTIKLSQFNLPNDVKLDAVRIKDAVGGSVGAAAAGADIDAMGIDCSALPVEILSIKANIIEEGVVILWKTGLMNHVAQLHLMRVPIVINGQLNKEKAILISQKNPYPTQNYGALDSLPLPGQYAYVVKETTDSGESIWHDNADRGEIAIIEVQ